MVKGVGNAIRHVKLRGGVNQRIQKRKALKQETKPEPTADNGSEHYVKSILAFSVVQLVLWEHIPATLCQRIADLGNARRY